MPASAAGEQSASTQEIAGAANTLGAAAERLSKLVAGLRITEGSQQNGVPRDLPPA